MAGAGIPAVDPARPRRRAGLLELATRFGLTRPGTWFYSQVAARIDPWLVRASRGRVNTVAGLLPIVLLSAKGARSGIERTVPLVYFTDGEDVILIASSFGRPRYPAWYHNVKANPVVRLEAMGRGGTFRAQEVEGAERERLFGLAQRIYRGYADYHERTAGIREIPVFRLSPAGSGAGGGGAQDAQR